MSKGKESSSKSEQSTQKPHQPKQAGFEQEVMPDQMASTADKILYLQRTVGNQAVNSLLKGQASHPAALNGGLSGLRSGRELKQATMTSAIQRDDELTETAQELYQEGVRLYQGQDYRAAIIRFERAREMPDFSESDRATLHYNIAMSNLRLRRFATAVYNFEQYLERGDISEENRAEGTTRLAEAREGAGVPDDMSSEDAQRVFEEGTRYYASNDFRSAIVRFERVRSAGGLDETNQALLAFNIGRSNMGLRRYATAIPYFEDYIRSLGFDPDSAQTQEAAADNADLLEALNLLREARQNAGMPWARLLFEQAVAANGAGNYDESLASLRQLYDLADLDDSTRALTVYNLGLTLHHLGNYSEAIRYYQEYLAGSGSESDQADARAHLDRARQNQPPSSGETASQPETTEETTEP
jgi:tetratricopeptide (TPR) repeat protein